MTVSPVVRALEAPAEVSELQRPIDFMFKDYALIGEPLNLMEGGQQWFASVYSQAVESGLSTGVVLGATPWLAQLVSSTCRRTIIADVSVRMLEASRSALLHSVDHTLELEFLETDWRTMPPVGEPIDVLVGDNSFSFLPYPQGWCELAGELADRMSPDGRLIMRVLSAPRGHRARSPYELVADFMARESINFTEVRAALLFSKWCASTSAIDTQSVLETFRIQRRAFDQLFAKFGSTGDNDLLTVRKYDGAGAVYYAPPIHGILSTLAKGFRVTAVRCGPYAMAEYFPLIVATRR